MKAWRALHPISWRVLCNTGRVYLNKSSPLPSTTSTYRSFVASAISAIKQTNKQTRMMIKGKIGNAESSLTFLGKLVFADPKLGFINADRGTKKQGKRFSPFLLSREEPSRLSLFNKTIFTKTFLSLSFFFELYQLLTFLIMTSLDFVSISIFPLLFRF